MVRLFFLAIAIFCFVHIARDILQLRGIKNWFTQLGHFFDAPKYEKHGMIILGIIGFVCLWLALFYA